MLCERWKAQTYGRQGEGLPERWLWQTRGARKAGDLFRGINQIVWLEENRVSDPGQVFMSPTVEGLEC